MCLLLDRPSRAGQMQMGRTENYDSKSELSAVSQKMRLPPLQTLLTGHSRAACVSDKPESYEQLEQLTGHTYADVIKGQQLRLDTSPADDDMAGDTLPFSSPLNQLLCNVPWLNE